MEHRIFDAAIWFVEQNGGYITSKKMQKLCYYAQAWSYVILERALFNGEFQAWVHGPVNKELWDAFKDISYRQITVSDFKERMINTTSFDDTEVSLLERVWETYGEFEGYQLEALTHEETPWKEQRTGLAPDQPGYNVISPASMHDYYLSVYVGEED